MLAADLLRGDTLVVIKKYPLPPGLAQDPIQLLRVCDAYLSLSHPGLAKPLNILVGDSRTSLLLVTEFVSGEPYVPAARSLSHDEFLEVVGQLCSVLQYLHTRGYAHLDLHPGNVLLVPASSPDGGVQVKLIDLPPFPLATLKVWRQLVAFHPEFSAPEVLNGGEFDHRADLFSLGTLLYGTLVGEQPIPQTVSTNVDTLHLGKGLNQTDLISPLFLGQIVRKLLEPTPDNRFSSCYFVLEDLNRHLAESPLSLDSPASVEEMIRCIPFVSTSRLLMQLGSIQEWLKRTEPGVAVSVEILGLPGSGKKRVAETLKTLLKLLGLKLLRSHQLTLWQEAPLLMWEELEPESRSAQQERRSMSGNGIVLDNDMPAVMKRFPSLLDGLCGSETVSIQVRTAGFASVPSNLAGPTHSNFLRITTGPLDKGEGESFIDAALHPNCLPAELKLELASRSLSLPGIIQSLLLDLVSSGVIQRKGIAWEVLPDSSPVIRLPDSTLGRLASALTDLDSCDLRILELLALSPYAIDIEHISLVLDTVDTSTVETAVLRLQAAGLLERGSEKVWIASSTIADMVRSRTDEVRRQSLAKRALKIIDGRIEGRSGETNAILTAYALEARDRESASQYALRAAEHFEFGSRFAEAMSFYEVARKARSTTDPEGAVLILEKMVALLDRIGDRGAFARFASLLNEALPANATIRRMRLLKLLARHHNSLGEISKSNALVEQALESARGANLPREVAECLEIAALNHLHLGESGLAALKARDSIRVRSKNGMKSETGPAIGILAGASYMEGDYLRAMARAGQVVRLSQSPHNEEVLSNAYNNFGILCMESGRLRSARIAYKKGLAVAERIGHLRQQSVFHFNLAPYSYYTGALARAAQHVRKALRLLGISGAQYGYHQGLLTLAEVYLLHGQFEAAVVKAQEAHRSAVESHDAMNQAIARIQEGWSLHHLGAYADSQQTLLPLRAGLSRAGYRVYEVSCALGIASNHVALGEQETASKLISDVFHRIPRQHSVSILCYFLTSAQCLTQRDPVAARRTLVAAVALSKRLGYRRFLFEASLALAQSFLSTGEHEEAGPLLRRLSGMHQRLKYRLYEPWLELALSDFAGLNGSPVEQQRHLLNARTSLIELSYNIHDARLRNIYLNRPDSQSLLSRSEGSEDFLYHSAVPPPERSLATKALESIARINEQLHRRDSLKSSLALIMDEALRLSGAERGILFLFDQTGREELKVARNVGRRSLVDARRYTRTALSKIRAGELVCASDTLTDPGFDGVNSITSLRIRSVSCVPLRSHGSIIGALYLDSRRPGLVGSPDFLKSLEIFAQQAAAALERAIRYFHLAEENRKLRAESRNDFPQLIGQGPYFNRLKRLIAAASNASLPVLILGETGTGKELVARAIHASSSRAAEPFLSIDCGALPENLVESELFGYKKGAFTGADSDKQGLFVAARGGTLFLDEIGNTTVTLQARLLRAIQEREVRPLGGTHTVAFQARIVAATNKDLRREAREGTFRQDLLFRLNGLTIEIPPLRDRKDEIPLFVEHFLVKLSQESGRKVDRVSEEVLRTLSRHVWPGNIRELENCMQRAVALARGGTITLGDLPDAIRTAAIPGWTEKKGEHRLIEEALYRFAGDKSRAADYIGWNRQKLYRKMLLYNIPRDFGRRNTA